MHLPRNRFVSTSHPYASFIFLFTALWRIIRPSSAMLWADVVYGRPSLRSCSLICLHIRLDLTLFYNRCWFCFYPFSTLHGYRLGERLVSVPFCFSYRVLPLLSLCNWIQIGFWEVLLQNRWTFNINLQYCIWFQTSQMSHFIFK